MTPTSASTCPSRAKSALFSDGYAGGEEARFGYVGAWGCVDGAGGLGLCFADCVVEESRVSMKTVFFRVLVGGCVSVFEDRIG